MVCFYKGCKIMVQFKLLVFLALALCFFVGFGSGFARSLVIDEVLKRASPTDCLAQQLPGALPQAHSFIVYAI